MYYLILKQKWSDKPCVHTSVFWSYGAIWLAQEAYIFKVSGSSPDKTTITIKTCVVYVCISFYWF